MIAETFNIEINRFRNYIIYIFLITVILSLTSCKEKHSLQQNETIIVNIKNYYPVKDIALQDIANVEYIPLETSEDILLDEDAQLSYVSDTKIIVFNPFQGDIFIFDGSGHIINKFNHKGESGEEYKGINCITYDAKAKEIFVFNSRRVDKYMYVLDNLGVLVYDEQGNLKRYLKLPDGYVIYESTDYSKDALLIYDSKALWDFNNSSKNNTSPFILISKKDGSVVSKYPITFKERISDVFSVDYYNNQKLWIADAADIPHIMETSSGLLIKDISTDTVYLDDYSGSLVPLVVRSPSVNEENDIKTHFYVKGLYDNYILTGAKKLTYDITTMSSPDEVNIAYDKLTKDFFYYHIYNEDYPESDNVVTLHSPILIHYEALYEGLEDNKIKGSLKSVVESMDANDNPIVMRCKALK